MLSSRFFCLIFLFLLLFQVSCFPVVTNPEISSPTTQKNSATLIPFQISSSVRVLILSIDGFHPDAIDLAPMDNLQSLMEKSAYSLVAQTTFPSTTLSAHASMLTGQCPDKHGADWNDYQPNRGFANGTDIFELAHLTGLRTIMVVAKEKLRQVTEPKNIDVFMFIDDYDTVIAAHVAKLIPQGFDLVFAHFRKPDGRGHTYGWLSPEQLNILEYSDDALATILVALDDAGLRDDTLIIVTADHGGHGTSHGSNHPEDMTIPWIITGPGVQPTVLSTNVNTMDTAATVAWVLGLPIPSEWEGIPVLEAFGLPDKLHPQPRCP